MGPVDRIICAGDCIDQSRFCSHTLGLLRELDADVILGNHDLDFLRSEGARELSTDGALREWLADRPRELRFEIQGLRVRIVHATGWSPDFPYVTPVHPHFARFEDESVDVLVYGHTHVPVIQKVGCTLVVNPGSVGEGRPGPEGFVRSCAVLDVTHCEARIIDID